MHHLSTAFLIFALVIVVNQGGGVTTEDDNNKSDQVAEEAKHKAVTIVDGPKYVTIQKPNQPPTKTNYTHKPEQRPPSKPPLNPIPDNQGSQKYVDSILRPYYGQVIQKVPSRHYSKPVVVHHSLNSVYRFPKVIPLPPYNRKYYYANKSAQHPITSAASTVVFAKSPKFSLPVQTINGVRTDFVRPPKHNASSTTTSTTTTTTQRPLRTKRIWPKKHLKETKTVVHNTTETVNNTNETLLTGTITNDTDHDASPSHIRFVYINANTTAPTTTPRPPKRGYVKWNGAPNVGTTTPSNNITQIEPNDWIPIIPSHYHKTNSRRPPLSRINKRSDVLFVNPELNSAQSKRMLYLQSYGLVPLKEPIGRKKMMFFRKRKRTLNPYMYSGYSPKPVVHTPIEAGDLHTDASHHASVITKIKHHHHHHHHRYIKTIEKPIKVPYKVEVPMPYPVPVEKKIHVPIEKIKVVERPVPYPVTVEKKVPYPVEVKVPHPVPVKVIEKEYIAKPYPVVHHVPVVKHVEVKVPQPVPVQVEKQVPYPVPVQVPVPVDRPVPVTVEKKVPYPVPFKVLVPQPYPVETKVPYPIEIKVKEPYEVIKHVPIKVPVPQPYAVTVKQPIPVPVEKKVPYPVEVEKKVPVPVEVVVPQKVEVEKKVPVYVPKPYPVEKRVPVPFRVPYIVKVPVKVPVEVPVRVPVYIHHHLDISSGEQIPNSAAVSNEVTSAPHHTVTVHGNSGFTGFQTRSDKPETTTSTPRL